MSHAIHRFSGKLALTLGLGGGLALILGLGVLSPAGALEPRDIAGTWRGLGGFGSAAANDVEWVVSAEGSYTFTVRLRNAAPVSGPGQIRVEGGGLVSETANNTMKLTLQNGTPRKLVGEGRRKSDGMRSWIELTESK